MNRRFAEVIKIQTPETNSKKSDKIFRKFAVKRPIRYIDNLQTPRKLSRKFTVRRKTKCRKKSL